MFSGIHRSSLKKINPTTHLLFLGLWSLLLFIRIDTWDMRCKHICLIVFTCQGYGKVYVNRTKNHKKKKKMSYYVTKHDCIRLVSCNYTIIQENYMYICNLPKKIQSIQIYKCKLVTQMPHILLVHWNCSKWVKIVIIQLYIQFILSFEIAKQVQIKHI